MMARCPVRNVPGRGAPAIMKHLSRPLALAVLLAAVVLGPMLFAADTPEWPRFRGPQGNPVSTARLADTWSKTQNVEWTASIPGRGWSSPIVSGGKIFVTAATTDGASKKPQIGTQYSNEYVAELQKQGLSGKEINDRVIGARLRAARRGQPALLPLLRRPQDRQGELEAGIPHGQAAGRASPQEQLHLGNADHRREAGLRLRDQPRAVGVRHEGQAGVEDAARELPDVRRLRHRRVARARRRPADRSATTTRSSSSSPRSTRRPASRSGARTATCERARARRRGARAGRRPMCG